ncbi:hypothetical protein ANN_24523, partial [Periplaneta americana]
VEKYKIGGGAHTPKVTETGTKLLSLLARFKPLHSSYDSSSAYYGKEDRNTTFKLKDVEKLVREAMEYVNPPKWEKVVYQTWGILKEEWEREGVMGEQVDELIITLGSSDSSSSEENETQEGEESGDEMAAMDQENLYKECGAFPLLV